MESILACRTDLDCPFQHFCSLDAKCLHQPVFPLQPYPIFVYVMMPFFITLCNIGGLSGGIFKIIVMMDMLNYSVSEATPLAYAMLTGGALANFILLLNKRHPDMKAPLVDHGLAFIFLPCVLTGTTVGVIVNKMLNDFIQNVLLFLLCAFFAYKYYLKLRQTRRKEQ